ncbi:NAD(P)/FAD-dependent oxidoreductase [Bacillus alkalicellulosilyticus]|uniref:NAD(P)/FAD-dependent oxidoreductase n=1 Tax=Alkalihalobacterium alkalicellulosilyticum TaxID=1912214 RepID=UPI000998B5C9|nr:NAD(P)/FAD-dependent oxidoreductase [Bacillus alkalicellulosilyticus]
MVYDCIIIGGGIAGLQAAIQLGRYEHRVLVIDKGNGRSELCKEYHNLLGWPDGVSGEYFRETGKEQAKRYGIEFMTDEVIELQKKNNEFDVVTTQQILVGKRILLATGIQDRIPELDGIRACLGKSIYLCPDCDGYEIKNQKTIVIGSGNKGVGLAVVLSYWTSDLLFINHDLDDIDEKHQHLLQKYNITLYQQRVSHLHIEDKSQFQGLTLENGETLHANHAFLAMKGATVQTDIAKSLGVERLENNHICVNPRTKETNVPNVWAAGDALVHSQLLSIAMGDGAQAAIWIHKSILKEKLR